VKLFGLHLIWRKPRSTDIVIYDRVGAEFIRRCLDGIDNWQIMDVRDTLYVHPRVFFLSIYFFVKRWRSKHGYLNIARPKILNEKAVIDVIQPKVVITFGENSERFGMLSRLCPSSLFLGVQNGLRGPRVSDIDFRLHLTNCLCFGQDTVDKYQKSEQSIEEFHIIGSLKNGLFDIQERGTADSRFDICFISQYRPARFERSLPLLRKITEINLSYIIRYCKERDKKFCIAGSCKENNFVAEYKLYKRMTGTDKIMFFPNDDNGLSSYKLIERSQVSITSYSTVGFEGLSRGNKILFFNPTDDEYFDVPRRGGDEIWRLAGAEVDYAEFAERLDKIFDIDDIVWRELSREYASYFVTNDIHHNPVSIINGLISECLVKSKNM